MVMRNILRAGPLPDAVAAAKRPALAGLVLAAGATLPPEAEPAGPPAKAVTQYKVSASPIRQAEVDIDGGGRFGLTSVLMRLEASRHLSAGTRAGLTLKYAVHDYDFENAAALGGGSPWNKVSRLGLSIPVYVRVDDSWMLGVTPSIDWLREESADSGKAESYGGTLFVLNSLSRRQSVGLGAGVFREIDGDTKIVPLLAVNWRFNERWRLANPFDAEALGPAGLELSYRINDRWRLGGGGVYRSSRFRLDREGIAPDGIGEHTTAISFLRLRRVAPGFELDFYVGAMLEGEMEVQDPRGRQIAAQDYDTAPFAAVTLSTGL